MANPHPSPDFKGKKGRSGRKTAYEERGQAKILYDSFFNDSDLEELKKKVASGVYSIWDTTKLMALQGDTRIINTLSGKVFPDKLEMEDETTLKIDV